MDDALHARIAALVQPALEQAPLAAPLRDGIAGPKDGAKVKRRRVGLGRVEVVARGQARRVVVRARRDRLGGGCAGGGGQVRAKVGIGTRRDVRRIHRERVTSTRVRIAIVPAFLGVKPGGADVPCQLLSAPVAVYVRTDTP